MVAAQSVRLLLELALVHYIPSDVSNHVTLQTKVECASLCAHNENCISFIFNTKTKDCMQHRRRATEEEAATHGVNNDVLIYNSNRDPCLAAQGYTLNLSLMVCYKLHETPQTHASAEATCLSEGGDRLLRIDNVQKKLFFDSKYAFTVFVDGEKIGGQWVDSDGDAMLYLPFNNRQPSGDGTCLDFYSGLNDLSCTHSRSFICEKHI